MTEGTIVTNFLPANDPATIRQAMSTGKKILDKYGQFCEAVVFAPNFVAKQNALEPSSGFSALLDTNAPVYSSIFHPKKMNYGTVAIPLNRKILESRGTPITESYVLKNARDLSLKLNASVHQYTDNPLTLKRDLTNGAEISGQWDASLGSGGAYAGIYSSVERDTYDYKNRLWLVTQCGNESASEEIYKIIEDCQPDWDVTPSAPAKCTIKGLFSRTDVGSLTRAIENSREKILSSMAEVLGLESRALFLTNSEKRLSDSIVSTISYNLTRVSDSRAIYHSATVDPVHCKNGIVMNENPFLGPTILKGPPIQSEKSSDLEFGASWRGSEGSCGAFPTGTGRVKTFVKKNLASIEKGIPAYDTNRFISESKGKNLRMAPQIYRVRDPSFKNAESMLGYQHSWGEVHLRPLVVKTCDHS